MKAVIEYDRIEREERQRKERGEEATEAGKETAKVAAELAPDQTAKPMPESTTTPRVAAPEEDSDEYEEVEVTDDEDAEDDAQDGPSKRPRLDAPESSADPNPADQPVEFNEDDIAYQLAAMGQDYGLDPGEYGAGGDEDNDEAWEEGAEGLALTEEDSLALFNDMLDDHRVSPYTPWETLISGGSSTSSSNSGNIVDDERYVALTTMKARKEAWQAWSRARIAALKERREREEKKDPKLPYFAFLEKHATPKLYWPEFRRKFRGEREMRDSRVADKEREKWYREYIGRMFFSCLSCFLFLLFIPPCLYLCSVLISNLLSSPAKRSQTPRNNPQIRPNRSSQIPARYNPKPQHRALRPPPGAPHLNRLHFAAS